MESLLPIALILNFVFLAGFGITLFLCLKRGGRITALENLLKEAGSVAASSQRTVESLQEEHHGERERLQNTESDLATLQSELDDYKQRDVEQAKQIQLMTDQLNNQLAELDSLRPRTREAEDRKLALDKECAKLRSEMLGAAKRVEAAESVARDKQIQFERTEAALEAKDKALLTKQQESADQDRELAERRNEITELVAEREKLQSMEVALTSKLKEAEESLTESQRVRQSLNDELAARKLELSEVSELFARLRQLADEQAAAGGAGAEQCRKLKEQLLEVEAKLARKEAALSDLEQAYADTEREKPYEAHRHMDWTINHFDPKAITFKFTNEGAKVFLVGVETNIPELRYEFETGHDLPREDFEARIKLAIRKAEQKKMEQLPDEFDMTVLYALNVFPIKFKIRPREGQRIERIH